MHIASSGVSIAAASGRVAFLLGLSGALLMTFAASLVLLHASVRFGVSLDDADLVAAWLAAF